MNKRSRMTDAGLSRLYTPEEVADALRCSEWWVKEQARRRRIPFTRVGGAYRFTEEHWKEIVSFFEERPDGKESPDSAPSSTSRSRRPRGAPATSAVQLRARRPRRLRDAA